MEKAQKNPALRVTTLKIGTDILATYQKMADESGVPISTVLRWAIESNLLLKASPLNALAKEFRPALESTVSETPAAIQQQFIDAALGSIIGFLSHTPAPFHGDNAPSVKPAKEFNDLQDFYDTTLALLSQIKEDKRCPDWIKASFAQIKDLKSSAIFIPAEKPAKPRKSARPAATKLPTSIIANQGGIIQQGNNNTARK